MKSLQLYKTCIKACFQCAALCNHCAASYADHNTEKFAKCIQLDMECAAICYATAQIMSFGSSRAKALCLIGSDACADCANECGKYNNEHCRECARACRRFEELCTELS